MGKILYASRENQPFTLYIKPLEENKILVSPGAMSKPGWESRSVSDAPCQYKTEHALVPTQGNL